MKVTERINVLYTVQENSYHTTFGLVLYTKV